jgi:copper homeostasis protein
MPDEILIEVCVDSVASAAAAQRGGAQRVELCADLIEGGITPSAGMIALTRSKISIALHVLIRPRGGDFVYDDDEFDVMCRDIDTAKNLGADGLVFGILDADGNVDIRRSRMLVERAQPLSVTFHRAFDMSADLFRALEDVCGIGAHRILTSGGHQTALQGLETIVKLVNVAKGRLAIMPGSGIKPDNARRIVEEAGALEIHAGLKSALTNSIRFRNPQITLGSIPEGEYQRLEVLEESVRNLRRAASQKGRG